MKSLLRIFVLCGLGVLFWKCATTPKPQQGFYPSGKLRYAIDRDKDGRKIGQEKWWHENGTVKYQAVYRDGFRNGEYSAFYTDGKLWYQGFEIMGRPESTLTYWYPTGKLHSVAFFRQGIQLSRQDYDEQGHSLNALPNSAPLREDLAALKEDSIQAARDRNRALEAWAKRVRATVESHWVVPKALADKGPLRAVASVKVRRNGVIEGVTWIGKSPVASFNSLAASTFKKLKKLPPFPKQVTDATLEIEYAFVSGGQGSAKSRLQAGQTRGQEGDGEGGDDRAGEGDAK